MKKILIVLLLFWGKGGVAQLADFGNTDFRQADSLADQYYGASLYNLPLLAHNLTAPLTSEVEKFRAIYTWVCKNISNDYGDFLKNKKMRAKFAENEKALEEWNAKFRSEVFQKLLKKRTTVCTGDRKSVV